MKLRAFIIGFVAFIIILYIFGNIFSGTCIEIGKCKECWKNIKIKVNSSLCSTNESCYASPEAQQRNAIVDALLCACEQAGADNYADSTLNSRIEFVVREYFGFDVDVRTICENPGMILVKMQYY